MRAMRVHAMPTVWEAVEEKGKMKGWCCEKIFKYWREDPDSLWYKAEEVDADKAKDIARIQELEKALEYYANSCGPCGNGETATEALKDT